MTERFSDVCVYVGCSLTHATKKFMSEVEKFKSELDRHCRVLDFLGCGTRATPREIYDFDIRQCIYTCDFMVAVCDQPSTGLGYEIATMTERRQRPVLAVAHHRSKVSDLILDPGLPGFTFNRYEDLCGDVIPMVQRMLPRILHDRLESDLFRQHNDLHRCRHMHVQPTPNHDGQLLVPRLVVGETVASH